MARKAPRLGFQILESRHAMAGIVTIVPHEAVVIHQGDPPPAAPSPLDLVGDGMANGLEIRQLPRAGGFVVSGTMQGGAPTMIQYYGALASSLTFPGWGASISVLSIDMKGGDDRVSLAGSAIASDVRVSGGDGNDTIEITATLLGSLAIEGGDGNDLLTMTNSEVRSTGGLASAVVAMGGGLDKVSIQKSRFAGNLWVFGFGISGNESAAASIDLADLTVGGNLLVNTSDGNDTFFLRRSTVTGTTTVDSAGGGDRVSLVSDSLAGSLTVRTGSGADTVTLNVLAAAAIVVDLGEGDDLLVVRGISVGVGGTISFNGGPGTDRLRSAGGGPYLLAGFP